MKKPVYLYLCTQAVLINFPENEKEKSKSKRKAFWEKLTGFPKKLKMLIENMIQKVANLYHKGIDVLIFLK